MAERCVKVPAALAAATHIANLLGITEKAASSRIQMMISPAMHALKQAGKQEASDTQHMLLLAAGDLGDVLDQAAQLRLAGERRKCQLGFLNRHTGARMSEIALQCAIQLKNFLGSRWTLPWGAREQAMVGKSAYLYLFHMPLLQILNLVHALIAAKICSAAIQLTSKSLEPWAYNRLQV